MHELEKKSKKPFYPGCNSFHSQPHCCGTHCGSGEQSAEHRRNLNIFSCEIYGRSIESLSGMNRLMINNEVNSTVGPFNYDAVNEE